MSYYDPKTRPKAKYLCDYQARRAKESAYVTMDIVPCDNPPESGPFFQWFVTCSNYNYQLRDFCEFAIGRFEDQNGCNTFFFPLTEDNGRTLIEYFHAKPTLAALAFMPALDPYALGDKWRMEIQEAVFNAVAQPVRIPGMKKALFPFQTSGVMQMSCRKGRALLADEMGLGKTLQALGFWRLNNMGKTLIVCPQSIKLNWQREILESLSGIREEDITVISGAKHKLPPDCTFYIINYDILQPWQEQLKTIGFDLLVLDEAHYIKNSQALRTKSVQKIAANIPYILALTGTPVINRAVEIWTLLHLLKPEAFSHKSGFVSRYTQVYDGPQEEQDEETVSNMSDRNFRSFRNPEELGRTLRNSVMIRRTKKEVLKDLPPKIRDRVILACDAKEFQTYKQSEEEFESYLAQNNMTIGQFLRSGLLRRVGGDKLLGLLAKTRVAAVHAKMDAAVAWIRDFIENEEKLVVFAHHKEALKRLSEEFPVISVSLTGDHSAQERQYAVDAFQNNPAIQLIFISITAGGIGITLTAASQVAILETSWSPGQNEQAEDRVHRIGQTADCVNVRHLVGEGTIDLPIYNLIAEKEAMIEQLHRKTEEDNGATVDSICAGLNAHLNSLGLKVTFDPRLFGESLRLKQPEWFTIDEAVAYARENGSKIIRSNLLDDIKKDRFQKETDLCWISQVGGRGGYWKISKEALLRRMEERLRGRGRPKKLKSVE